MADEFMKIELETQYLRSALLCASTEKTRYYLNGVCITFRPKEKKRGGGGAAVFYDSTDGRTLFSAWRGVSDEQAAHCEPFQIILGSNDIKFALRLAEKNQSIELSNDGAEWRLGRLVVNPIDGAYPNVADVFPSEISDKVAHFNPELVVRVKNALCPPQGVKKKRNSWASFDPDFNIRHNGDNPAVAVGSLVDAVCLVIPMRVDPSAVVIPAWAAAPRVTPKKMLSKKSKRKVS